MGASHDEVAKVAQSQSPNFTVVTIEFLYAFKLRVYVSANITQVNITSILTLSPSQYLSILSLPTVQK